jgi:hypothetical protein
LLKKYQPERTDLLINTDWGIPRDGLSPGEAQKNKLLLFQGRWVTKEEKKQLKDERNAYASIRVIGYLLIFISVPVLVNIRLIAEGGIASVALAVTYAFAAAVTGSGLIRYARFARYPAMLIFLSFFVLPFTPLMESEKGTPLLFILGMAGLYYFLRRTARKIFWPGTKARPAHQKIWSAVRKTVYTLALLAGISVGYYAYDMMKAKQMAADACHLAKQGMLLGDYLRIFPENDYKIIHSANHIWVVPKRGLGRNHCTVQHNGQIITGAKAGYVD